VRHLEPRNRPPAAPTPPPPRREASNKLEPAAAFLIPASGGQFRRPGAAQVGDLDPHHSARDLDRDCDRPAGITRPAMPNAVAEYLAHQHGSIIRARVTVTSRAATKARATRARSARPASVTVSRTASPAISATTFPAARTPGEITRAIGATHRDGRSTWCRASSLDEPLDRGPESRQAATHTAHWPRFPSAMRPWTPQHNALQRYKVTRHGTEKNAPVAREFAAIGAFSQVAAGVVSRFRTSRTGCLKTSRTSGAASLPRC
jgi:hypothetical protein